MRQSTYRVALIIGGDIGSVVYLKYGPSRIVNIR